MAAAVTIAVRRQVLDAEVHGTERDGLAVQRHLSGGVEAVVARALQEALDGVVAEDDHLVVDRLDIDVEELSLVALDEGLADAIRRETAAFFRRHLPPHPGPGIPAEGAAANTGVPGRIVRRGADATLEEAFVLFLRTGRMPWAFRPTDGSDLARAVETAWGGAGDEPASGARGWEGVRRALEEPRARLRVVKQFPPTFVHRLVRRLDRGVEASMAEVSDTAATASPAWSAFVREVRLAALVAVSERRTITPEQLTRRALVALPPKVRVEPLLVEHVSRRWPGAAADLRLPDPERRHPARVSTAGLDEPHAEHLATPVADTEPAGPSWLVDHAGLVLLHPFLPRFLEGLGLAKGERLLDPERAVALLHHLATGETVIPEHEATVAKLLCGWPLEDPVERDPGLTGEEVAEATAVLTAVVGHWEALRNTSPEALRAEFLSRPGVLSVEGGDWVLRVEQRSVDILLEQLPWGISMVRTPWATRLLHVEWRA